MVGYDRNLAQAGFLRLRRYVAGALGQRTISCLDYVERWSFSRIHLLLW